MFALQAIIAFLIILPIIIFVHEWGHFIVARMCKVRVEAFSIGFGKELFGWTDKHKTRWKVCAIPLGGYCQMFGQSDVPGEEYKKKSKLSANEKKVHFVYKSVWQRFLIVLAGPAINFIFAIFLFTVIYSTVGQVKTPPVIGEVIDDSAAEAGGLKVGDRIVSINGQDIEQFENIKIIVVLEQTTSLDIVISRGNQTLLKTISPQMTADGPLLGIAPSLAEGVDYSERLLPHRALWTATSKTFEMTRMTLKALYQIITGERSAKQIGGILRIAEYSGEAFSAGLITFILLMAAISINLGIINLFPLVPLDGGHLLFFMIEVIKRKPLSERMQEWIFRIGIAFVIFLMLFATWNDVTRLISKFFN